jgi:hypothetical protein
VEMYWTVESRAGGDGMFCVLKEVWSMSKQNRQELACRDFECWCIKSNRGEELAERERAESSGEKRGRGKCDRE